MPHAHTEISCQITRINLQESKFNFEELISGHLRNAFNVSLNLILGIYNNFSACVSFCLKCYLSSNCNFSLLIYYQ
jgi:hypothetical protein